MLQLRGYTATGEQRTDREKRDQSYQSAPRSNSGTSLQVSYKKGEIQGQA